MVRRVCPQFCWWCEGNVSGLRGEQARVLVSFLYQPKGCLGAAVHAVQLTMGDMGCCSALISLCER